jgi:mono/diheme cytochrome c family protein
MKKFKTVLMLALFSVTSLAALEAQGATPLNDPSLTITSGDTTKVFTRSQLLTSPKAIEITIAKDVSYFKEMKYRAFPAKDLFDGFKIPEDATLVFKCLDGFSAPLTRDRLLNPKGAVPYLAIESADEKWPDLKGKSVSAGPFYLVWLHPEAANIGAEEWPYQLSGFEVRPSLESEFPHVAPGSSILKTSSIYRGYQVFTKNCFACHTLNGEGKTEMGPDLNLPHNPTEYFKDGYLLKLVRNPQDLRQWPQSKMSAFDTAAISDSEFNDLEHYLKYMSTHKYKKPQSQK